MKYEEKIAFRWGLLEGTRDAMRQRSRICEKPQKLTVCIVTQDCARKLVRAIESVLSVADEIVVVDGGSSDNTKEVVTPQVGQGMPVTV